MQGVSPTLSSVLHSVKVHPHIGHWSRFPGKKSILDLARWEPLTEDSLTKRIEVHYLPCECLELSIIRSSPIISMVRCLYVFYPIRGCYLRYEHFLSACHLKERKKTYKMVLLVSSASRRSLSPFPVSLRVSYNVPHLPFLGVLLAMRPDPSFLLLPSCYFCSTCTTC